MDRKEPSSGSEHPRVKRAAKRKAFVRDVDLSTTGMVFPIAMLIGYFGGGVIGGWFGNEQMGSWIGLGLGLVSGFYNLFKIAMVLQRREEQASAQREEAGSEAPSSKL